MQILKLKALYGFKTKNYYSNLSFFLYALLLFSVPVFIPQQLITGTIINALLISAAIKSSFKKAFVLSLLPSLAVASTGFLFGSMTSALLLMIPFIWLGNWTIVFIVRKLFVDKAKRFSFAAIAGSTAKTLLLFASTAALYFFALVPALFLVAFGLNQFITAISGAVIVGVTLKIK